MSANVFANGREISAKKDSNKSMGAMPDVCLSPPSPPAGPVPVPYPNFSMGSDTSGGTKQVKIKGKEAGIKNNSNYKKSKGNEAATRSFGMGVISHALSGKMQHAAWSMDVKFEGKNVIRFMDMTTHNHGSQTNAAVTINGGGILKAPPGKANCKDMDLQNKKAQEEKHPRSKKTAEGETIASAHYDDPGGDAFKISSSSHMSDVTKKNGWAHGYRDESGTYKPTKICKEADFEYSNRGKCQSPPCHAESRIAEVLFNKFGPNPTGTLTLRISHRPQGSTRAKNKPCPHCREMLCAAQKCGLTVKICTAPNKRPKKLRCEK